MSVVKNKGIPISELDFMLKEVGGSGIIVTVNKSKNVQRLGAIHTIAPFLGVYGCRENKWTLQNKEKMCKSTTE